MIHSKTPVTMAEVKDIVDKLEEKQELKDYLKAFTKLSKDKAAKMTEEINGLNNVKIKSENAVKVVDFMPATVEDVRKIFVETSLTDEEANAILNIVAKY
jgi:DNA-directed RNA polymerase subunit F